MVIVVAYAELRVLVGGSGVTGGAASREEIWDVSPYVSTIFLPSSGVESIMGSKHSSKLCDPLRSPCTSCVFSELCLPYVSPCRIGERAKLGLLGAIRCSSSASTNLETGSYSAAEDYPVQGAGLGTREGEVALDLFDGAV